MGNIPQQGFKAALTEGPYRDEMESVADSIRKPEEMLAGAKHQSRDDVKLGNYPWRLRARGTSRHTSVSTIFSKSRMLEVFA